MLWRPTERANNYAFGITYSWYHFLSRYFDISWCAVPLNCCASFDIRSALSSNLLSLSPRSTISMCARLTSLVAEVARVPSSWILAFGPEINFATERLGLPLAVSPTVVQFNEFQLYSNEGAACNMTLLT